MLLLLWLYNQVQDTENDTDGQKNVNTTYEIKAVRRSERQSTRTSVSFDFVRQYEFSKSPEPFRSKPVGKPLSNTVIHGYIYYITV